MKSQVKGLSDPYTEGYEKGLAGVEIGRNPFPLGSEKHRLWIMGWRDGDRKSVV